MKRNACIFLKNRALWLRNEICRRGITINKLLKRGRRDTIIAGANYSAPSRDFSISHLPPKQDVPLYGTTFTCKCEILWSVASLPSWQSSIATRAGPSLAPPALRQSRDQHTMKLIWKLNTTIFSFDFRNRPLLPSRGAEDL